VFGGIVTGPPTAFFWARLTARGWWTGWGSALESLSDWMSGLGAWGAGVFGVANRALLVIGLHQFLNVPIWFQFGSYTKPDGTVVHGDINMLPAGDPDAGRCTTGFFPIMMFAPPAAAPAITHSSRPNRRKEVGGARAADGDRLEPGENHG
jgi:PTS system N-acetylglucosamine-specific IIC component